MEENVKEEVIRKRLTPESTIIITIGTVALAIVIYGIVRFIIGA